jgi:hypothetical protein
MRCHKGRRLHHVHERRQGVLRDDSGMLRLPVPVHGSRLHVLRLDGRNARLLRLLLTQKRQFEAPPVFSQAAKRDFLAAFLLRV